MLHLQVGNTIQSYRAVVCHFEDLNLLLLAGVAEEYNMAESIQWEPEQLGYAVSLADN